MGSLERAVFGSRLFPSKAILFGSLGGLAGYLLGTVVATTLGPHWAGVAVAPLPALGIVAVAGATLVSAAASLWPARAASKLDPCVCFQDS